MQTYDNLNRNVLRKVAELIDRHPTLRLPEILEKFDVIHIADKDKHTAPDTILARLHLRLFELSNNP